jgi:hypothetical protein
VRRPPGRRDEAIEATDLDAARLAAERDLDALEEPLEPAVGLDPPPPRRRERADRVDRDDAHPLAPGRQPRGEVELPDVPAEEVLQVDRRDE